MQHEAFLTPELTTAIFRMASEGIQREYPNQPAHLLNGAQDLRLPKQLHPAFYGCYDWHSAVHSHWTLLKLLEFKGFDSKESETVALLMRHLSPEALETERKYFLSEGRASFERPYGWAWIWKLAADLRLSKHSSARHWGANIRPLADLLAERYIGWLQREEFPCRAGTHGNTAFALDMGLDFALAYGVSSFETAIRAAANRFFGSDQGATFRLEPSGNDFISPILAEMAIMSRICPDCSWQAWMDEFLADPNELASLRPVAVPNRSDGQGVHLDGLNLSRAWHLRRLADKLPGGDAAPRLASSAHEHWGAGREYLLSGDFLGEHWLGTFAVLAATELAICSDHGLVDLRG